MAAGGVMAVGRRQLRRQHGSAGLGYQLVALRQYDEGRLLPFLRPYGTAVHDPAPLRRRVLAVPAEQTFARYSAGQRHAIVQPVFHGDEAPLVVAAFWHGGEE